MAGLEAFSNESFLNIGKSRVLNNKEFISYRMSKLNDSYKEALTKLEIDRDVVEKLNEDQFKVGRNIITRLVDNPYGINMFCKGCDFELSNLFCDCSKYTKTKF